MPARPRLASALAPTLVTLACLAGCVVNGVKPLAVAATDIPAERAIVVLGVTVQGAWPHARFGVTLDQYDAKAQAITGDCFIYNRVEASVPATPTAPTTTATPRFFAFDVPAGHYVFSAFNATAFAERDHAFQAAPGHAVYVGDFVLGADGAVTRRTDLDEHRAAIAMALPDLRGADLEPAPVTTVAPGRPFLCTP